MRLKLFFLLVCFGILVGCRPAAQPVVEPTSPAVVGLPIATTTPVERDVTASVPTLTPFPAETPTFVPSRTHTPVATPLPSFGEASIGDPYTPELGNTGYDVQHYTLKFGLNPGATTIDAVAELELMSTLPNLVVFSLDFVGFEITSLTVNGVPTDFTREGEKLNVSLANGFGIGERFVVSVTYSGTPTIQASPYVPFLRSLGLQILGSSMFVVAQPDGARYWFPANDHPLDKATFRFELTVPTGMTGVATGVLVETRIAEDANTFVWVMDDPMATYLASVAVGEYERIDDISPGGIPIRHYVFPDLRQPFLDAADVTGEALDWMAEMFGPYPYDSFGFVTTRIIRAALETQTMVVLSELMLNEQTVVHEIVHMWFGNWVSMASWADMWNNEGFAVYFSLMWQYRDDPVYFNDYMAYHTNNVAANDNGDPMGNLPASRLFGYSSYQKGAAFIHAIRLEVGDDAFFNGLRVYLDTYGGGTATRDDFQRVMEETSGVDLDALFAEWLE